METIQTHQGTFALKLKKDPKPPALSKLIRIIRDEKEGRDNDARMIIHQTMMGTLDRKRPSKESVNMQFEEDEKARR